MRVLMTGSSATQVGSDRIQKGFFGSGDAIRSALLAMGNEVVQRVPDPEADIQMKDHDLIVAGVACIATLGGRWAQDIYWMVQQWNRSPFPMVMYMPDWHAKSLISTAEGILRDPDRVREKSTALGRPHHDWAMEHVDEILEGVQLITEGKWPPFILHRFPWGSEEMMAADIRASDPWSMDPSGYMPQWPFDPPDLRIEEWTCPRLQTLYDPWLIDIAQRLEWPVTKFGNQRMQEPFVTEDRIPQVISESAGTLVPPGYHSGMGLWRSRYLMAAWTRTPMYADPAEGMGTLDPSLTVVPWAIEGLSISERADLAEAQSRAILSRVWTRQQFVDRLQFLMSTALGRDLGRAPLVPEKDEEPPKPMRQAFHPLLQRVSGDPRQTRPTHRTLKPCCAGLDLLPGQTRIRGHHPECTNVARQSAPRQPRPFSCECATWEIAEEMGPRVRGHHPNCEKAQRKTSTLPPSVNKADRPKPGEEGYLEFDANSQMYHRPGTLDYYVIHEVKSYERMGILPSDVVLDVGAHIGGFTTQALKRGARVYAFEPDPENYDILVKNTEKYGEQVVLSPRAVTSDGAESAVLYLNVGANTGTHSLLPSRGRDTVRVETEDFQALLNRVQPTVLKVDIEGGEYALDWSALPDSIRLICMELHRTKKGLHEKSIELANHVSSLGYEYTKVPKLEGGAWAVLAIWQKSRVPAASVEPELVQV